jgi:hypothetical protein
MKLIVSLIALCFITTASAQTPSNAQPIEDTRLFAQCMFSVNSQAELDELTVEFYNNHPEIEMVRFDMNTQRALIITTGISTLSEADLVSWFGQYSGTVYCVQIGVYCVDTMNPYPFTNCNNQ